MATVLSRIGVCFKVITFQQLNTLNGTILNIIVLKRDMSSKPDCVQAAGTPKDHADIVADHLITADYRGYFSHGMNRLEMYINDLKSGACDGASKCCILQESPATAWVDGQSGLGTVIGKFCMERAIEKAKGVGVGWVAVKGSNHFGIGSVYALQAVHAGLLGMCFSNTSPLMSPTRAKTAALGTNPLALGAPAKDCDSFVLDMATTAVAVGKIEYQRRKKEPIPEGWAQDPKGHTTTDPEVAIKAGCLMPLGGSEMNSGHKGYGLAMLVEVFCGILAGAHFGPYIQKWGAGKEPRDLGQSFVAINPECFAPDFESRLSTLLCYIRNMEPAEADKPVLVPGDSERINMKAADEQLGLCYVPDQLKTCERLAKILQVPPLQPL